MLLRKYWNSIDRERVSKVGFHASVAQMTLALMHQIETVRNNERPNKRMASFKVNGHFLKLHFSEWPFFTNFPTKVSSELGPEFKILVRA